MKGNVLIFIPRNFSANKSGFIEGFYKDYNGYEAYFITNPEARVSCKSCIGYIGKFVTTEFIGKNTIFINLGTDAVQVNTGNNKHVIEIIYDFDAFQNSDVVQNNNQNYGALICDLIQKLIQNRYRHNLVGGWPDTIYYWLAMLLSLMIKIFSKLKPVTKNCTSFTHFEQKTITLIWFLETTERKKKITPRTGNFLSARLIDIMLGILSVYICLQYKCTIITTLNYISQGFVTQLRVLLVYLMGAPIGLKLNYAFNHSLAKFFFYHINLWRVFLQAMQPFLEANFLLLILPAFLGISYQIAVFCDILSLATFHVYCIYVYAARNFSANKSGFIEGFYKDYNGYEAYFITNPEARVSCKSCIGYIGKFVTSEFIGKNTIFINLGTDAVQVNTGNNKHIIEIIYDFDAFQNSDVVQNNNQNYGAPICDLIQKLIQNRYRHNLVGGWPDTIYYWLAMLLSLMIKIFSKLKPVTKNCTSFTHFEQKTITLKWFLETTERKKKITPRTGNFLSARLIDIMLGILSVYICLQYKCTIITTLNYISQGFVTQLRVLLVYLMGAPIGLKLNYAFNHSLAKFFFYHINLWRVFLQAMQPFLEANFLLLILPAFLGISYQIAVFCDILSLATFHVYCIYVYAARLFSLQIKSLTSLWRLFIGRKFNPLRSRVDSCEYTSNQLFIGTLKFTVLLFLLPTTSMYYTVFVAFRLVTLLMYKFFYEIRKLVGSIPLYIVILWIFRSPSIAGTLHIDWTDSTNENTRMEATLSPLSLNKCIQKFSTHSEDPSEPTHCFTEILSHVFTGQLI